MATVNFKILKTKPMLQSYLKIIFRNFFSDGMYSSIIVFGLAVGIAVSLIIGQYIYFELSFDKQYKDGDRIYYTYMNWKEPEGVLDRECHPAVAPLIKKTIPEVESAVRFVPVALDAGDEWVLYREHDGKKVDFGRIDHMYAVDPEIFDFFSIPLLAGDSRTALVEPNSIVITKSLADKFFPNESPLDKILKVLVFEFKVTGVIEDSAPNSTLQHSAFFSMNIHDRGNFDQTWIHPVFRTFIKLNQDADKQSVEEKINQAAAPHLSEIQKKYDIEESIHLYPFRDFHFYKPYNSAGASPVVFTGDKRIIGFFAAIAILILIICWANYINLTIARALRRAKEVGLRKVSGARRSDLILQFLSEFLFLNIISLLVAFTITQLLFSSFATAIGSKAEWILWSEPWFWLVVFLFLIVSTLSSGIYPAFVMSNYNPVKVLKGSFSRSQSGMQLRKALVLVQFGLSAFLLMSIYVISRQLIFMQTKDLGMSVEQVLVVRLDDLVLDRNVAYDQWKIKMQNRDDIVSSSAISTYPGDNTPRQQHYQPAAFPENRIVGEQNTITQHYFETMNIPLLYGRTFRDDRPADSTGIIINETAVQQFGFANAESALGQEVTFTKENIKFEIIGVVKDFTTSLKRPAYSSFFHYKVTPNLGTRYFTLRLNTANLPVTMSELEREWETLYNSPFDYFFLDSYFDTFYREERQFAGVFGFFSIVGVVITCMGLFGLSMYNTNSRTKEIGIRKSLGSSSRGIMWLLSKEYLNLVLVAGVICIPVGAWLLNNWLKNYPQRIEFGADFILAPLILMILIAQFTVGYQTYKAAHSNPVNSLRNE
jgi:putative ABC transport system permease protein